MDPYPLLHNSTLPISARIDMAFEWMASPAKCPVPDQGPASARCYALYRAIDGLLTDKQEKYALSYETSVKHVGLSARWAMSNAVVDAYLAFSREWDGDMMRHVERARKIWDSTTRENWPPQILNLLRINMIGAYWCYLHGDNQRAIDLIEDSYREWKLHMSCLDWHRWPYRVSEAKDDLTCLQSMAFISRAAGHLKFTNYDWCQPERIWPAPHATTCPAYAIMRRMSLILKPDGEGVIWQYRPRQGSKVPEYTKIHAEKPYGRGGMSEMLAARMKDFVGDAVIKTAIDYGCGKSRDAIKLWPDAAITKYDPAIKEVSNLPRHPFDIGLCTEVLEHIPLEEIDYTIWEMRCLSRRWVCTIHTAPAGQKLSTGENAHCLQRPAEWWESRFKRVFGGNVKTESINSYRFILSTCP